MVPFLKHKILSKQALAKSNDLIFDFFLSISKINK